MPIQTLPAERVAEVEHFVDFILVRDQKRNFTRSAEIASASAFGAVWSTRRRRA